jgi:hypothetical protein
MPEKKNGCLVEVGRAILYLLGLFLVVNVGIMLFGSYIKEWEEWELKETTPAKRNVTKEIYMQFGERGILEQRVGKNLRIYISRENLRKFPFPEREKPLKKIGSAWCENIEKWHFPKVYFYDVDTGNKLGSYSCVFKYVTVKNWNN